MSAWQSIRLLRARPPFEVTADRQSVFASALEQSEQLMRAAATVGPAARPLPLFYALSQAGRAIAACRLVNRWRLSGHGLSMVHQPEAVGLLRRQVKLQPDTQKALTAGRLNSFAGVSAAVGSEVPSGTIELGAVWAAIPDLMEPQPQMPTLDPAWRRPLIAFDEDWDVDPVVHRGALPGVPLRLLLSGLPPDATPEQLIDELAQYPTAAGAEPKAHRMGTELKTVPGWAPSGRLCPAFAWPGRPDNQLALDTIAPMYRSGDRTLLPRVAGNLLSPLMLWWVLLFGLSSVARYDPELWVGALDVNHSEQAVPIEAALDAALDALSELILDALTL
jgi:YaaC-like Protein